MIWNIIRSRSVMYRINVYADYVMAQTEKKGAIFVENRFNIGTYVHTPITDTL